MLSPENIGNVHVITFCIIRSAIGFILATAEVNTVVNQTSFAPTTFIKVAGNDQLAVVISPVKEIVTVAHEATLKIGS